MATAAFMSSKLQRLLGHVATAACMRLRLQRLPGASCLHKLEAAPAATVLPGACSYSGSQKPAVTAASRSLRLQRLAGRNLQLQRYQEPAATVLLIACGYSTSKSLRLKCCLELAAMALPASCNYSEFQAPLAKAASSILQL